ncbi:MAG: TIM barrel protein [Acidobacteriota bacterium]
MKLGINLSFAIKRWQEPDVWARLVRETLGLRLVQFTYDLLDPFSPETLRRILAAKVRQAARDWDLEIESAFSGLAGYCSSGLLHPERAARRVALEWWKRSVETAAEIGASAAGGALGAMSVAAAADPARRNDLYREMLDAVEEISRVAGAHGLERLLIEATPVPREIPWSIEQAARLMTDLNARCAVPVQSLIDVGHALYQPLYGPQAGQAEWLGGLGPHSGGRFDLAAFAAQVRAAGLADCPAYLEVFYPFEMADDAVLANVASSVLHCRREYGREALPTSGTG